MTQHNIATYEQELFKKSFPSSKQFRTAILEFVLAKIKESKIELELSETELKLILDEAVANAMEHGNTWNRNLPVTVSALANESSIKVTISDQGDGFNVKKTNSQTNVRSRRGRGLKLISHFCNCSWNITGNEITLTINKQH